MKIALASPPFPSSLSAGLSWTATAMAEAAASGASIICFPESWLPGYPVGYTAEKVTQDQLQAALEKVCALAATHSIAVVLPMDWHEDARFYNLAFVIDKNGRVIGRQTKNQLDPSEDTSWDAGIERSVFDIDGLRFGIVICHEGFRYPEAIRWSVRRGAQVVFHPHCAGNDESGYLPVEWQDKKSQYYEKAQMVRALENTVFFATSNYGFRFPETASALIGPQGECIAHQAYGTSGVLVT
ncbi:MAG: carbon-nitrogen hydrolase family protein [Chitinophagaceae bacterium]|nr:MAG: carbon-nitrogen hydrolase family protein [Chitinophagaceae bacterium]